MKKIIFTLFCLATIININAQINITIGGQIIPNSPTESSPINIYYKSHHCQVLYTASELNGAGWIGSGIISKLGFNIFGTTSEGLPNFSIKLKNTTSTDLAIYDNTGLTTVYTSASYLPSAGGFELLNLGNTFLWDGTSNILVDVCFDKVGNYSTTGQVYTYSYTSGVSEYQFIRADNTPQCDSITNQSNLSYKPQIRFEMTSSAPCSGTPNSGIATTSNSLVCSNTSFNLSLLNGSNQAGISFQWQSSIDASTWTNLGSSQSDWSYSVNNITDTTYYRCVSTCTNSTLTNTSTPIVVNFNPLINCYCMPGYALDCTYGDKFLDFSLANVTFQQSNCDVNGYSDSTASAFTVINLTAGNTYSLQANIGNSGFGGNMAAGAWIDYNQNGIFDASEFTYLGNGGAQIYSNTLTVPISAASGSVRMRLKIDAIYASATTTLDPCYNNNGNIYGQIVDYKVNITAAPACTGTPSAGIAISSSTAVCNNTAYTLDLANNSIASDITYQWQSSLDGGVTWSNIGAAQNTIPLYITSQNNTTHYRCITTCTNSTLSDTSIPVMVSQNLATACYCNPGTTYCSSVSIYSVSIANLNYSPTCNYVNGYTNYSDSIPAINLNAGSAYNLLTAITTFSSSPDGHVSAWIDYNQNGIFENPSEFISVGSYTTGSVSQSFTIPFTTLGGNTRMRIKLENSSFNYPGADPCIVIGANGQTLDYLVNITPSSPCSGLPNAGNTISTSTTICGNSPFTLNLSGNDLVSNINYQWQSSPDSTIWTNMGTSQTSVPYTITNQSNSTYYRCALTCSTNTTFSSKILITQNLPQMCNCIPPPSNCNFDGLISNVIFSTLNHSSACSNDGYINYADSIASAPLIIGQSYSLALTVGSDIYDFADAWIDYDQDGEFEKLEFTSIGQSQGGGNFSISNSILIPTNATIGNTKIRVRNNNGGQLDSLQACDGFMTQGKTSIIGQGETEDYLVTILPASETVTGITDICSGNSTTLNLSPVLPSINNLTYQWKSFNGTTYVNDGTASISPNFTATPGVNTLYFCEIMNNGNVILRSDTILIKVHTITVSPITTSITCNGMTNGSITLNATDFGGILNYTWSPTATGNDVVTNLAAGIYTVLIANSINCTFTQTFSIVEPLTITATETHTNVSCFGLSDGAASMTVNGGTLPFSFSWMPFGGNALTANNLSANNYTFNIVDGNGCTQNEFITITEPVAMTVSIAGKNSICEQLEDTITSSIIGGVSPFIYSWTELPGNVVSSDPNYTYTSTIGTYSYNLNVTDATNCTVNSNTISITVNPSSNLSGTVTTDPLLPVAGTVILFKYMPFYTKFDSVTSQNIGSSGDYNFISFTSGIYIIKVVPTANNLQIAYGDSAVNWKTAKQIIHGCAVNDVQNIKVKALSTFTNTGTGSLSGKITEGDKFGKRIGFGFKPMAPGGPIGGIVVKGGRNPGGQMFVQTITDSTGYYSLPDLPINSGNESYFILVDIPGLDTNNTYHQVITLTNNAFVNLDFVVDSAKINPIHISDVSVHDISAIENQIKVYPNPATKKVTIQYNLLENSNVKIELCDILGKSVKTILPLTQQNNSEHSFTVQLNDITSGMYFMKVKINNSESVIKLIINN